MNRRLQRAQDILRRLGLLSMVEALRFAVRRLRLRGPNAAFCRAHPDFPVPPESLAFDAYGTVDWAAYRAGGLDVAGHIVDVVRECGEGRCRSLLEWGCGPARVLRHLPGQLPGVSLYGSDYNEQSIAWCREHVPGVTFAVNGLHPPLPFEAGAFDFVYAVSVFTHLSEDVSLGWSEELARVLRKKGLLLVWTNGDAIAPFLLAEERSVYEAGQLVVRGRYKEGRKMFLAFHPPAWVRGRLLRSYEVLRHWPGGFSGSEQDVWLARARG